MPLFHGINVVSIAVPDLDSGREFYRDNPVVFPGYVTYATFLDPFGNQLQMCSPAPPET